MDGREIHEYELRLHELLEYLYPEHPAEELARRAMEAIGIDPGGALPEPVPLLNLFSERDVLMIAYADSFTHAGTPPLRTLKDVVDRYLTDVVGGVHLLPFYPSSSDGGFAVTDYHAVDPALGTWQDVEALSSDVSLMVDLVLNHVSRESEWFRQFVRGELPGRDYFVTVDPRTDLSAVVRPRTHPLLQPVATALGGRHVWCTFSDDQVDLDYGNPDVLLELLAIVDRYLQAGARFLRLDAVGYLWKEVGTSCIHLPQTHGVIQLLRTLLWRRDPRALLVAETNVPNRENLTYFGNRNEAHVIYNFGLPPLILEALLRGSAENLQAWMMSMPPAPRGCTYLNLIACHDGIGLRPAEDLLARGERDLMIEVLERGGALIGAYATEHGPEPYELNVTLFDALAETEEGPDEYQVERFVCAHTIMLALEGIPAFYYQSLFAGSNDLEAVERTGHKREINRRRMPVGEIEDLVGARGPRARVLTELRRRLAIRRRPPAFHPNATQFTLQLGPSVFAFWRQSLDRDQSIFALHNVGRRPRRIPLSRLNLILTDHWHDLLGDGRAVELHGELDLGPYQSVWLANRRH
jgi:sucrose phosphorylase